MRESGNTIINMSMMIEEIIIMVEEYIAGLEVDKSVLAMMEPLASETVEEFSKKDVESFTTNRFMLLFQMEMMIWDQKMKVAGTWLEEEDLSPALEDVVTANTNSPVGVPEELLLELWLEDKAMQHHFSAGKKLF